MAQWYTANIVTQGGTCYYSTLYYYQYSNSAVSSADGWYETKNTSTTRVHNLYPQKNGCTFVGGFANADGTGTKYANGTSGSLWNLLPSELPSSTTFNLYLCWDGPTSANLSKTNLSGGPTSILYYDGNLYDDASMSSPLQATTVQDGGQTVTAWGPITLPAKECYAFRGYYSGSNNSGTLYIDANGYVRQSLVNVLASRSANDDPLTIYANGVEVSKKLTLSQNGGSGGISAIYNSLSDRSKWYADSLCEGGPITSVPIPGKITSANVGYVFDGYKYSSTVYIDPDGSLNNNLTSLTNFTSRTATAKWLNTTKMTVDANGGTGGDAFFYWCSDRSAYFHTVDGALVETTAIVTPSNPGYAFAGLYTAATDGTQKVAADGTIASGLTSATTLYAQWTKTAYVVTFSGATLPPLYVKASGGGLYRDADCEDSVESGDILWDKPPTIEGQMFLGVFASASLSSTRYATNAGVTTSDFASLTATEDITVYCLFAELQPVTFDDAGGTGGIPALWYIDHAIYEDGYGYTIATWPLTHLPSRECFAFLGYFDGTGDTQYVDPSGAMTQAFSDLVSAGITEPLELFAQWDRLTWRVTLDDYGAAYSLAGGGNGWFSDPEGTSAITSVPIPEREGYDFLGYFTTGGVQVVDSTGSVLVFVGGDGDVTLAARWQAKTFTLSFSDGSASKSVTWGVAIGTLPTPTPPTGMVFEGWMVDGAVVTAATAWRWTQSKTAEQKLGKPKSAGFSDITDWFDLASSALVPIASTTGDTYHRVAVQHGGKYESGVNEVGKVWRNPSVTYVVKADTTVAVQLGKAWKPRNTSGGEASVGASNIAISGYMITTVEIVTEVGKFPTVTVSAVANEGANAVNNFTVNANKFNVSVPVVARSKAQNLLGAISGGGYLQRVALVGTCDPVVCEENLMPCASDIVNGRYELTAETLAANGEDAPTMAAASGTNGGFALLDVPRQGRDCDFLRYQIEARKEMV